MGLIILPFLLFASIISIYANYKSFQLLRSKYLTTRDLIFGFGFNILIFNLVCISSLIEGKAWALSPVFRIPCFMVFLPFLLYIVSTSSKNKSAMILGKMALICSATTGILALFFQYLLFDLLSILGVEQYY